MRYFLTGMLLLIVALPVQGMQDNSYLRGLDLLVERDTLQALEVWADTVDVIPDPRIGVAFLETVVGQNLSDRFEEAVQVYRWGFSGDFDPEFNDTYEDEIIQLKPLVDESRYLLLRENLKRQVTGLPRHIYGYWKQQDPTPSTPANERLIEHWKRVLHARVHFTRGRVDPYDTDARGPVYVRYGQPDLINSGRLKFVDHEAKNWIDNIVAADPHVSMASVSSAGNRSSQVCTEYILRYTKEFYNAPEYEIWTYRELSPDENERVLFLFGTRDGSNIFERVETVEELTPARAFSSGSSTRYPCSAQGALNIRPGLILQLLYYNQLATSDPFFGKMLNRIESRVLNSGIVSVSLGQEILTRARTDLVEARLRAPEKKSVVEELMNDIPLAAWQYRLLDEQGQPVLATFLESEPQDAFLIDYLYNYASHTAESISNISSRVRNQATGQLDQYDLFHNALIFTENGELINEAGSEARITVEQNGESLSYLELPHHAAGVRQVLTAELHNRDTTTSFPGADDVFRSTVRGTGKIMLEQPEPIATDQIEMGDVIFGYGMREKDSNPYPFTISHERRVPVDESLVIHIELYNLELNGQNIADFSLSYELKELNSPLLRWLSRYKTNTELKLNLQADDSRFVENLEIQTRELDPQTYLLRLHAVDNHSGNEVVREMEFDVIG